MKKKLCLILFFCFVIQSMFSIEPVLDILFFKGQEFKIYFNFPLDPYLKSHKFFFRKPKAIQSYDRSYKAFWEIRDNKLFLTDILILNENLSSESVMTEFFNTNGEKVLAEWFSGEIYIHTANFKLRKWYFLKIVIGLIVEKYEVEGSEARKSIELTDKELKELGEFLEDLD